MKRIFDFILILAIIGLVFWGVVYVYQQFSQEHNEEGLTEEPVGDQTDEHGCLGGAGYSWCEVKQECLRVWEKWCPDELTSLVTDLETEIGASFISQGDSLLRWRIPLVDKDKMLDLPGERYTTNLSVEQYQIVDKYFQDNFIPDLNNMADGVMGGMAGYTRGYMACSLRHDYTSSTVSEEGPLVPDTSNMDVEINCGLFNPNVLPIDNFADCVAIGNPVMESYPRQCRSGDQTFTEDIGNEMEKMDLIRLNNPRPNQTISSPLEISGEARGTWFFEADFPVVLTDWDGKIIAEGYATADGDWMTEEFVPFTVDLEFTPDTSVSNSGSLILRRANPSGLPANDDVLEVPVLFD